MKKPYVRALTQQQPGVLSHVKGSTWIRMHLSLNGSLCGHEKGLCQFQPGFTLLRNVQWLNWWHVFAHPCQNQWGTSQKQPLIPTPQTVYGRTSHPGVLSNSSAAPNTQGPFDRAESEQTQLLHRRHVPLKATKIVIKRILVRKQDFKKEAISRHYKVLKLVRAFTIDLAMLVNFGAHDRTMMFFFLLAS